MKPSRPGLAGARLHAVKVRGLLDEIEWQRQRVIIAALLPYSGARPRPYRFPTLPPGVIPIQRRPSVAEQRVIRAAPVLEAHRERVVQHREQLSGRIDIENNRTGR